MFAIRQIVDNPVDVIAFPPELRHRRTEVIFIALDNESELEVMPCKVTLASLAGCWAGEELVRTLQPDMENRREFD